LLGLQGGEVTAVGLDLDPVTLNIRGRVEVMFFPERIIAHLNQPQAAIGKTIAQSEQERHTFVQQMVEKQGLRAQLRSGSLLTGQLYVALDDFPDAPKVTIDWSRDPTELPVVPSLVPDLEAKLSSVLAKLEQFPYEAIGDDLKKALVSLDQMLKAADKAVNHLDTDVTPVLKTTLDGLHSTIATADGVLKSTDATLVGRDAPGQQDLRAALYEVTRAARSLRILTNFLERHPGSLLRGKGKEN
jgi:paraquat-inducible protein B